MTNKIKIGMHEVGDNSPTYFIADIASNHDGSLEKAKELIQMCAEAGANAAKFQNFFSETIICDSAFDKLGGVSHQSDWKGSVFENYKKNSVPLDWTPHLKKECERCKIDYFTAPYDINIIDELDKHVCAWKIGSGEITWHDSIKKMAEKMKPVILATGASTLEEVKSSVELILKINKKLILMQCNTNYTGSLENFKSINLNVLKSYKKLFPQLVLGLSDHTPGHSTVLGAVSLGARVVEKHFTNDNNLYGPDHPFSMNPKNWKIMVERTRELEISLGNDLKKIEENEIETVVIQRRGIRVNKDLEKGKIISEDDLSYLRPCTKDCLPPYKKGLLLGKKAKLNLKKDQIINEKNVE